MTITSIPLVPAGGSPTPGATSQRAGHPEHAGRDDRFGTLVEGHLAAGTHGHDDKPAGAQRHGHDRGKPTGDTATRPAADPSAVTVTVPVAGIPVPITDVSNPATGVDPTQVAGPATQNPQTTPAGNTAAWISRVAARVGLPVTRPTGTPGDPAATQTTVPSGTDGSATTAPVPAAAAAQLQPVTPQPTPQPAPTPAAGQPTATVANLDQAAAATKHGTDPEPAAVTASADSGPSAATNTPAVGVPPSTPVGGTATASAQDRGTPATAVLDQVLPTLPRMVSRGDGTHSLTLRLHPADLGEVHLTVTVKNGTVDITLAAGAAARDALRDGAGQLRSLLDVTGHTAGQLVIRDLPASTAATPVTAPTDGTLTGQTFADTSDGRGGGQQPDAGPGRSAAPQTGPRPDPAGRAVPEPRTTTSTRAGNRALDVRI